MSSKPHEPSPQDEDACSDLYQKQPDSSDSLIVPTFDNKGILPPECEQINQTNVRVIARIDASKSRHHHQQQQDLAVPPQTTNRKQQHLNRKNSEVFTTPKRQNQAGAGHQQSGSRAGSTELRSASSRDPARKPIPEKQFSPQEKYSVFTTTKSVSQLLVLTEKPISGKLVNDQLHEPSDFKYFLSINAKNGLHSSAFKYDRVYCELQRQELFFVAEVMPMVQNMIQHNVNGSVILSGPSGGGKTHCMTGRLTGNGRGILPRAVEKLIQISTPMAAVMDVRQFDRRQTTALMASESDFKHNENERTFLRASIYLILKDQIYDLLSSPKKQGLQQKSIRVDSYIDKDTFDVQTRVAGLSERLLTSMDNFNHTIEEALSNRVALSVKLEDPDMRKRSHIIVNLSLYRRDAECNVTQSQINFVELAGSEQSLTNSEVAAQRDTTGRYFITKALGNLSRYLVRLAQGRRTQYAEDETELVSCLRSTLTPKSNILMVNCLSPQPSHFQHTLFSVQDCARIREKIVTNQTKVENPFATVESCRDAQRTKEQLDHVWKDAEVYQNLLQGNTFSQDNIEQIKQWCLRTSEFLLSLSRDVQQERSLKPRVTELIRITSDISARLAQIRVRSPSPMSHGDEIPTKFQPLRKSPAPQNRDIILSTGGDDRFTRPALQRNPSQLSIQSDQPFELKNQTEFVTQVPQQQKALQNRLVSPGSVHENIRKQFNDPQRPISTIYKSERDTLEDIQRLIVFEDFEGIKTRMIAMHRERIKCEVLIDAQIQEIKELREQIVTRDILVSQSEQINQCNQRDYAEKINDTLHQASEKRQRLEQQIMDLQQACEVRTGQIESLRHDLDMQCQKHNEAVIFGDEQTRSLLQAQANIVSLEDQNQRATAEFHAYKAHQEVIVQSLEQKQDDTKRHYHDKCQRLQAVIAQKDADISHQSSQITQLEERIRQLQQDTCNLMERQQHDHSLIQALEHTSERKTREYEDIYTQLTQQKTSTEVQKTHAHKLDLDLQEALKEIANLRQQSDQQNSLIDRLEANLLKAESSRKDLQDQYDSDMLRMQKELHEAHMQFRDTIYTKDKEIDIVTKREDNARQNYFQLQQDYSEIERQHRSLQSYELDKVNVMQANSELHGRNSALKLEIEELSNSNNQFKSQLKNKANECHQLNLVVQQLNHEIQNLKRSHDEQLEGCRHERETLAQQLDLLSRLNADLRSKETKLSSDLRQSQIELREGQQKLDYERQLGDKASHSSGRLSPLRSKPSADLESKINDLNSRLNALQGGGGTQQQQADQERPEEPPKEQVVLNERDLPKLLHEEQKDAFKDIKQMLSDYKRDRALIKSGQYTPMPSESGAMRVMNAFQITPPLARQETAGFNNHSFGLDSEY